MKTLFYALLVFLVPICAAQSSEEKIQISRPSGFDVVRVIPNVEVSIPVTAGSRKKSEIDLGDFVKTDAKWKPGEEAVVRIDAKFGFENVWFRNWLHYSVTVFVGDGTSELPFEVKGTIATGRKGLRSDNTILKERLATAISPVFSQASDYLRSGKKANQLLQTMTMAVPVAAEPLCGPAIVMSDQ
jgi:hypothetical protein